MLYRMQVMALILLVAATLVSCAAALNTIGLNPSTCGDIDNGNLRLTGPTDEVMLDCVQAAQAGGLDTIIISSSGGSASIAMDIGDVLAPLNTKIIVEDICASSCANYLLPVANHVIVSKNALIMLHGSIDPGFVRQAAQKAQGESLDLVEALHFRQADYRMRHSIPKAWLLWREQYRESGDKIVGLIGRFEDLHPSTTLRSRLIVGPDFMKSCFPHQISDFSADDLLAKAKEDQKLAKRLSRNGYFTTGGARCNLRKSD